MIEARFPAASFRVERSRDEPASVHLITIVDEDPDAVLDVVIDRLLELQVEERVPVHVIPLLPPALVAEQLQAVGKPGPG